METLSALAKEINSQFLLSDKHQNEAVNHRIAAGIALRKARAHEDIGHGEWGPWLAANVKRSPADARKCMALAKSNDPAEQAAALERQREAARAAMAAKRANNADVSAVSPEPATAGAEPAGADPGTDLEPDPDWVIELRKRPPADKAQETSTMIDDANEAIKLARKLQKILENSNLTPEFRNVMIELSLSAHNQWLILANSLRVDTDNRSRVSLVEAS